MKKLIVMAFVLMVTVNVCAQKEVGTTTIYPKVGVSFSKMINSSIYTEEGRTVDPEYKTGLTAGFEVVHQLKRSYGLSVGLLYSMQGVHYDIDIDDASVTLHYLNVPVLLNGYLGSGFSVKAGVQGGYMLSAKNVSTSAMKRFDFSIPVGLSFERDDFVIDLRYNFGLTKTYKYLDDRTCNRSIVLTVGYGIDI